MKKIIYISKELEEFSKHVEVNPDVILKDRKPANVDLRDIFVWINLKKYPNDIEYIMNMINRNRSSFYASIRRFNLRYKTYNEYRVYAHNIETKVTGQLKLF